MKCGLLKKTAKKTSEKGFTAIELVIAMTIFLIVMGSVYGLLKIGNMSRTTINSRTENIKNVRMAIDTIGREAVNAGLGYNRIGGSVPDDFTATNFGLPADPDQETDLLTAVSEGVNISPNDLSKNGEKNDVVAFAFRDFQFNDGFPIIINDVVDNGTSLTLKTPDGACANCRPYDLFLIETGDGKQAIILSTDIVNNNSIVLGGNNDPLNINYGKTNNGGTNNSGSGNNGGINNSGTGNNNGICLPGDLLCINLGGNNGNGNGNGSNSGNGNGNVTNKSTVKKCNNGNTKNCIDYTSTTVVAKKIYLVSYSVEKDGTLLRTTYGNNTGVGADQQIVKQPIAKGVRSFKIKYLLSDGTVTTDPSVLNTQKERCNEIVQIEVTITVESESDQGGVIKSDPITLTSTFSTRNLKYDNY